MDTFQYQALQDPKTQIRLLTISLGNDDVIECSLNHAELQEDGHCCLSYCWGTGDASHRVLINQCAFYVRPSLYEFLLTARHLRITQSIWIDAVCINQNDLDEKSIQVELMGEIYSLASKTFVWLGVPLSTFDHLYELRQSISPGTDGFKEQVEYIIDELRVFGDGMKARIRDLFDRDVDNFDDALTHDQLNFVLKYTELARHISRCSSGIDAIFLSAYWTRAWINQEIIQSKQLQVLTLHGNMAVSDFMDLNNIINVAKDQLWLLLRPFKVDIPVVKEFFEKCPHPKTILVDIADRSSILRDLLAYPKEGMGLEIALRLTYNNGCLHVRDRIYAIRSLIVPEQKMSADYRKSHNDLFSDILQIMQRSGMRIHAIHMVARLICEILDIVPSSRDIAVDTDDILADPRVMQWARLKRDSKYPDRTFALYLRLNVRGECLLLELPVTLAVTEVWVWPDLNVAFQHARSWWLKQGEWVTCGCRYSALRDSKDDYYAVVDEECCFAFFEQ